VVPARLRLGGRTQDVALRGLPERGVLRHIVATDYEEVPPPPAGALVGSWVAARLGIERGDVLPIELRDRRRRTVTVDVVGLVDEPLGASVFMSLEALGRLIGEPATFSGVNLLVDSLYRRDLYRELKRAPQVRAVELRRGAVAGFRAMSDTTVRFIRQIVVVFSVIIAYGMVYNTARIALAERGYELATLRVLGFTRGEVLRVLLGEIGTLALVAIPLGCGIGTVLSVRVLGSMGSERFRMPTVVEPRVYAFAILVFAAAAVASALLVRRRLARLDLLDVLKARE
jgi:putative ABC transport system permease protein